MAQNPPRLTNKKSTLLLPLKPWVEIDLYVIQSRGCITNNFSQYEQHAWVINSDYILEFMSKLEFPEFHIWISISFFQMLSIWSVALWRFLIQI